MNPVTARERKKGGGMSGMVEVSEVRKYEEQQRCMRQRMCRKEQRTMMAKGNKG